MIYFIKKGTSLSKRTFKFYSISNYILSLELGLNFTTFLAGIWIAAPVRGFLPVRALRCETENVPNPGKLIFSPFFSPSDRASVSAPRAFPESAFDIEVPAAMASINCALFILNLFMINGFPKDKQIIHKMQ